MLHWIADESPASPQFLKIVASKGQVICTCAIADVSDLVWEDAEKLRAVIPFTNVTHFVLGSHGTSGFRGKIAAAQAADPLMTPTRSTGSPPSHVG